MYPVETIKKSCDRNDFKKNEYGEVRDTRMFHLIFIILLLQKTTPETVLVAQVPLDSAKGAKSRAGSAKQILVLAKL